MDFKSKRVLVTGALGKSGRAAAKLLADLGAHVLLSDSDGARPIPAELNGSVDVRPREDEALLSEHSVEIVVTAPGVPLSGPLFAEARRRGIPVYGENDLALGLIQERSAPWIIAVTGTDGKSTTTALTAHLFNSLGIPALPCGNFGVPLSSLVLSDLPRVLVVECSSFQLEPAEFMHAHCSMILNLSQDHLDRYASLAEYLAAKLNVTCRQTDADVLLAPRDLLVKAQGPVRKKAIEDLAFARESAICFPGESGGKEILPADRFHLPGAHNRINLNCALFALDDYAKRNGRLVDLAGLASAVESFRGLPHRMQPAGEANGVVYINDSKATTVQAALSGLTAFENRKVILLCGGYDKGLNYGELRGKSAVILPFGQAGAKIAADTGAPAVYESLEAALRAAQKEAEGFARSGEKPVVYLGPACASYDAYNSYEERGDHFTAMVKQIERGEF